MDVTADGAAGGELLLLPSRYGIGGNFEKSFEADSLDIDDTGFNGA